jgi:hypothetical protein
MMMTVLDELRDLVDRAEKLEQKENIVYCAHGTSLDVELRSIVRDLKRLLYRKEQEWQRALKS